LLEFDLEDRELVYQLPWRVSTSTFILLILLQSRFVVVARPERLEALLDGYQTDGDRIVQALDTFQFHPRVGGVKKHAIDFRAAFRYSVETSLPLHEAGHGGSKFRELSVPRTTAPRPAPQSSELL
jgi:hypothetical protein